ncbi:NAD synthetase [Candidatus Marinamargulisbacteria bacterium SCGC AG-333-B06]|nr:NAD synthetase [Candidatus Marinamargulisbacteria bacterium SCGC AG-333-B06]
MELISYLGYLLATCLFIFGLKRLGSPHTARHGNMISAGGMLIGILATFIQTNFAGFQWVFMGIVIGTIVGVLAARLVAMTAMPEMVALLNGFGGGSSLLVAFGAYLVAPQIAVVTAVITVISIIIGGLTLSGSIIAWAKLAGTISTRPFSFFGQQLLNAFILIGLVGAIFIFTMDTVSNISILYGVIAVSLVLGILSVMAIGGGDMPVVIALLNSYSGIAAAAAGSVIGNVLLIVAGLLVGASGLILTSIMCKAMNRSLANVLFGGFGSVSSSSKSDKDQGGEVNPITADDAYFVLEAARSVVIVPGYGMAVAQAQHSVRELGDILEEHGVNVRYAIHPVAGRMPGHMNVLLAESNVPYEQLFEMDDINPIIDNVDVCLVIGANDVVNPDALEDDASPIYGMPIIEVSRAHTVFVMKRSMNPGFAGIQNPLFFKDNTRMLFGDAKESLQALIGEFKD